MEYSQSQFRLSHVRGIIKNMKVSVVLLTIVALMVVAIMPLGVALAQQPNPSRVLPDPATVYRGETFNVIVTFTSPTEPTVHFNNAFLVDSAPDGWNVTADAAWSTPHADNVNATGNQASFTWTGEFNSGTNFTALYKVTIPDDVEPGNYTFSGLLGYYLDGDGSHQYDPVAGDSEVEVRPPLIANFTANNTDPCVNTPILFTDLSTGDITSWNWTFEGGSPPNTTGPGPHTVTYNSAGSYDVSLTVGNEYGNDTKTETGCIVVRPAPTANFTVDNTNPCVNTPILFTDSSTGDPTSWSWDFGDGDNSTDPNPSHQYSEVGIYNVSLTVENVCGSNTTTKTNYITVSAPPIADFTVDDNTTCVNTSVNFSDLSSGNPTSWLWDFGDGDNSTVPHPSHQYSSAGTYNVSLTVSNACGSNTTTRTGYIMVTEEPTANFTAIPTIGCVPLNVTFSDESTGTIDNWSWDVDGDGVEDYSTQNITHTYTTAGTYNVSLTVNNTCGSDTKTDYITVYSPSIEVVKTVSPTSIYSGAQVNYTYNVTNTGDVNLTNVTVIDDKLENLTSYLPDNTLTAGEWNTFTVTANPTATVTNTVTVTGNYTVIVTGLGGAITGTVTDTANATVTVRSHGGGGGAGGGGGGGGSSYLDIDMLGKITKVRISYATGTILKDVVVSDANNTNFVEIDRGTTVICDDTNKAPKVLVMSVANQSLPAPDGSVIIGSVYNFTGRYTLSSCGHRNELHCCSGVSFDQNITIVLDYDPNELPESTASVAVAYYDTEQGSWVSLPTDIGRVAEIGKATGLVNHCSAVAVIAELAPPSPASFIASDLAVEQSPQVRKNIFVAVTGEDVTITANVANNGGQEGTYIAELKLNGEMIDAKEVTLAAGQNRQVTFSLSGMDYGQYEVEVAGLSGEFTVSRSIDGWSIFDIIAGVGLIAWGAIWGIRRRKPAQPAQPAQSE